MDAPADIRVFERRGVVRTTLAQLEAFHRDPEALRKLTPPPIRIQVRADSRRSLTEGEIVFTLWFGPLPVRWNQLGPLERQLRAPQHWLHAIKAPAWIIEGAEAPGNRGSVETLCAPPQARRVQCALVAGKNHFSVLQPTTRTLAAQLILGEEPWLEPLPARK